MTEDGATTLFRPVQTGRTSERIVERMTEGIRRGQLSVGQRLPSERELTRQLNVSRVTIRDALRILEARGLVEIRVGAHGGAFVTAPAPRLVAEGITDMLVLSDLSPEEVTEARQAFELALIPLVCEHAVDDDIADLRAISDRAEAALADGIFEVGLSAEFHVRLARATHNHAVELMADALQVPLLSSLQRARAIAPEMGKRGVVEHRQIVEAIQRRDVERATSVMTEHLARTARRLRRRVADAAE
ncbi:MAG TPA: FCD domain-containing protein [Actinomycetes bacterium]|jgi:DNA-binding FadR family transcriptional regulator|nr:FCD domain-containing protein [Actinomycetes bacterium]